jgi:transcriptional pleiotropic regulator of transition state genes
MKGGKRMKSIGIVRRIDPLGRIVIPKETRDMHGIENGDAVEIYVKDDLIVLKKHNPGCIFCGECDAVEVLAGKPICHNFIDELKEKLRKRKDTVMGA